MTIREPSHVERPAPSAIWDVSGSGNRTTWDDDFRVSRYTDARNGPTVGIELLTSGSRPTLHMTTETALRLATAIESAAQWEDAP